MYKYIYIHIYIYILIYIIDLRQSSDHWARFGAAVAAPRIVLETCGGTYRFSAKPGDLLGRYGEMDGYN